MADTENKSDFQAITTQEALDKIIESRLVRERAKYPDYDTFKVKAAKLDETEGLLATTKQELNVALGVVEELKKRANYPSLKPLLLGRLACQLTCCAGLLSFRLRAD